MVALGDPRSPADPVHASSAREPGTSRWVDSRTWSYDFAQRSARRRALPLHAARRTCTRSTATPIPPAERLRARHRRPGDPRQRAVRGLALDRGGPSLPARARRRGRRGVGRRARRLRGRRASPSASTPASSRGAEHDAIIATRPSYGRGPHVVVRAAQRFPNGAARDARLGPGRRDQDRRRRDRRAAPRVPARATRSPRTSAVLREQARGAPATPSARCGRALGAGAARLAPRASRWSRADGTPPRPREKTDADADARHEPHLPGPFPENATFRVELPADLTDESRPRRR